MIGTSRRSRRGRGWADMRMATYCITTGAYDSYRVVAHLEGPARPALSTLVMRWVAEYRPYVKVSRVPTAAGIEASVRAEMGAERRLRDEGYEGGNLGELFVSWLKRNHGFTEADVRSVHI